MSKNPKLDKKVYRWKVKWGSSSWAGTDLHEGSLEAIPNGVRLKGPESFRDLDLSTGIWEVNSFEKSVTVSSTSMPVYPLKTPRSLDRTRDW